MIMALRMISSRVLPAVRLSQAARNPTVLLPSCLHPLEGGRHKLEQQRHSSTSKGTNRSPHLPLEEKGLLVERLLAAKTASGKTFDDIADDLGLTNAFVAQLFLNQAQLSSGRVDALRQAVPSLSEEDLSHMQRCPFRSFDDASLEEPLVYRLLEAVQHYGEGLKMIINEKFGDGIMSAIDFYLTVDKIKGKQGEDRVLITFNGKFLPHVEQTKDGASSGFVKK